MGDRCNGRSTLQKIATRPLARVRQMWPSVAEITATVIVEKTWPQQKIARISVCSPMGVKQWFTSTHSVVRGRMLTYPSATAAVRTQHTLPTDGAAVVVRPVTQTRDAM